ncbi:alpha/beta hydrolase, partial [Salmonella enterica subsp. enterica]|nr:alpha/beta hydrolase [Salmonella enterica subsp. enterica serovar Enteritidis]
MPFDSQQTVTSPTGAAINLYIREAQGTPRGVVQINHGLAEHAARYERFADFLSGHGYVTFAHDHRGHGYTKAPGAPLGRFAEVSGVDNVMRDVFFLQEEIRRQRPELPLIMFGHSMGGMIALNAALRQSTHLAGVAVWNSTFDAGLLGRLAIAILGWERMRLGSDVPSRILPKLTFQAFGKAVPNHRTPFDWLSRDPVEVDKYVADPLCGWDASVSLWRDLFSLIFFGADDASFATARKNLPFMLVCGDQDPSNDKGNAMLRLGDRMQRLGFSALTRKTYAGARHETLNDINRDAAMADFV